jgi:Protein of unknown function (DUF3306)
VTEESFLSRWSRRKSAPQAGAAGPTADAVPAQAASTAGTAGPTADAVPAQAATHSLPPVESLTPDSDFAAFMKPEVDPSLKREAFKKLIEDPRFNVMDGLDVYIDDYSKPDPLPEGWLEKMSQVRYLGIFKDDEEKAKDAKEAEEAETTAKAEPQALPDAPVSFPQQAVPPDTSIDQIPPTEVGKREGVKGGS